VADNTANRLPVGTNGWYLTPDSAMTLGLKWAPPLGDGAFYTCENVGGGEELFISTNIAVDPRVHSFRTLIAGEGIELVQDATTITINAVAVALMAVGDPSVGAKAVKTSAAQSLTSGVEATVTFDVEQIDDGGFFDPAVDNTKLNATTTAWYTVNANIYWDTLNTGYRMTTIRWYDASAATSMDVGVVAHDAVVDVSNTAQNVTAQVYMDPGDYITIVCKHLQGAAATILANERTFVSWIKHS
jgi:hypothetical protein